MVKIVKPCKTHKPPIWERFESHKKGDDSEIWHCLPVLIWVVAMTQLPGYFSRDMKAREPQKGRPRRNRDRKAMDSEQLFQYISGGWGCGWCRMGHGEYGGYMMITCWLYGVYMVVAWVTCSWVRGMVINPLTWIYSHSFLYMSTRPTVIPNYCLDACCE